MATEPRPQADDEHRPYRKGVEDLGPEGVNMEKGPKALRKMQSFLHFLAFGFFDHNFGVPRGEQPLGRASRAIGSSGTFFGSFWGSKRNT